MQLVGVVVVLASVATGAVLKATAPHPRMDAMLKNA